MVLVRSLDGSVERWLDVNLSTAKCVQCEEGSNSTYSSFTTAIPSDDTVPQSSEGSEVVSVLITPISASNRLLVLANIAVSSNPTIQMASAMFGSDSANAFQAQGLVPNANPAFINNHFVMGERLANTTSALTISIRAGNYSGSTAWYRNGISTGRLFGGVGVCRIAVIEYQP